MVWWNGVVEWCGGMVWWNGVVEWCGEMVWWNGVVVWWCGGSSIELRSNLRGCTFCLKFL
jgi:hypothetical protein